jgi:hypothetical protein
VQFDPLSSETRAALRRATAGVIEDVKKWVGADIVNKMLAASAHARDGVVSDNRSVGNATHR